MTEDVVRNGEGVHHVIRVTISGAPTEETARAIGKAIVNAPLFKCAVAGNDPNVGRLLQAIGKHVGAHEPGLDLGRTQRETRRHHHRAERRVLSRSRRRKTPWSRT